MDWLGLLTAPIRVPIKSVLFFDTIGLDDSLEMPRCRRWGDTALDLFELGRGSTPASIAMVAIVY